MSCCGSHRPQPQQAPMLSTEGKGGGGGNYEQLNFESRPKHIRDQTRNRLNQFLGGHYSSQNLSSLLYAHRVDQNTTTTTTTTTTTPNKHQQAVNAGAEINILGWSAPGKTKPTFEEAKRALGGGRGRAVRKGEEFGPSWTNHWFKIELKIPPGWRDYEVVQFEFDTSAEALLFTPAGLPLHGLTGGFGVERRVEHIIPEGARKSGRYEVWVEMSCNGLFGQNNMDPPDPNRYYRINSADLVVPNMEAWRLMWDFNILHQITNSLPWDSPLTNEALYVANEIINTFEEGNLESVRKCRKVAEKVLGRDWERLLEEERGGKVEGDVEGKERKEGKKEVGRDADGTIWGVGHCHIDTAWLWPFSATQQKCARSWSTQIDLMERFPEHRFSCTQAQQYKWLEQLYPLLFEKLKAKVETGQFQPVGATWVEMDVNMPSGEALCRQFLYGQRYFESRFGFRSPTFVLPDTFGYSSQLPQISRLAGCPNFFTQKLSWNSINQFPHSTFNWVGIDGSQVLTHMTPVNAYNAQADIDEIRRGQTGNRNLEVTKQALLLFGNGDGGGGPTPPMLEKLRRTRAVVKHGAASTSDIPLVRMGGSFDEFYESLKKETDDGKKLPNWRGELYFELHRGTYTTQALVKKGNRKGELLLREVEYAATMASLIPGADYSYPKEELDDAWEELLLCQFHDCLPGSGIRLIYDDVWEKHRKVLKIGIKLLTEAYKTLYPGSTLVEEDNAKLSGAGHLIAVNPTPFIQRNDVVPVAAHALESKCVQLNKSDVSGYALTSPSGSHGLSTLASSLPAGTNVSVNKIGSNTFQLANNTVAMTIESGRITSLYDKALEKELIPAGQTGGFIIFQDQPSAWDAWDVDTYHLEKFERLSFDEVAINEIGPLRASLTCTLSTGSSKIEVKISLDAVSPSIKEDGRSPIRFDAVVDWRERHKFLKFELPLDIHSDFATYHTQYGVLQRPTHRNTSWDAAKFEVCAHHFADLSEYGYGVAILNESKYGYATDGNVMRLSLLRSPTMPDADADQGLHDFAFAIYPHTGTYMESDVAIVAEAFNSPMRLLHSASEIKPASKVSFGIEGAPNVVIDTVKRAEDDAFNSVAKSKPKTIILRVYEKFGGHARARLNISGLDIANAHITNILEDDISKLHVTTDKKTGDVTLELDFRGFEIKTIKLQISGAKGRTESVGSEGWVKVAQQ